MENITEKDIIEAIKACLKVSPQINASKTLINTVYHISINLFVKDLKYVIAECPTGSGKTIIGFMLFFISQYLKVKQEFDELPEDGRVDPERSLVYYLTSNKMLQEQIDKDLDKFDFREYITILKGVANYQCIVETQKITNSVAKGYPYPVDNYGKQIKEVMYDERPCKGLDKEQRASKFGCDDICPYRLARIEAAEKACTVLNYAYFLNVMRSDFNPFFGTRFLTICDEGHLIPDIVCNIFNFEFTQFCLNQINKLVLEIELNKGSSLFIDDGKELIAQNFKIFREQLVQVSKLLPYFDDLTDIKTFLQLLTKNQTYIDYKKRLDTNIERIDEIIQNVDLFKDLIENRPEDVYFESEQINENKTAEAKIFKHVVKDLSEAQMVKTKFLKHIDKGILMSATLGDTDEYAEMMGILPNEYLGLRLQSDFDFSTSPIYLTKSGWLNFANFDKNIDKIIMDTLKICNDYHPKEKGIIHTSTFKICNLLKEKINLGLVPDKTRFLFYQTSEEKEQCVELMKTSLKPYIIVGPSLYEGLDLKDDMGRFNILMKVPYAAMTPYIKKKMERFPFWYNRNTKEKIVQAIGRTNRHINDYSTTYLLDSLFDKIIYETNDSIVNRLQYKTIY
jgi:Rad3-related DNA helicase